MIMKDAAARISLPVAPRPRHEARRTPAPRQDAPVPRKEAATPRKDGLAASPPSPRPQPAPKLPSIDRMAVHPHPDGWALLVDDIDEPAWVVPTKKQAVAAASDAASFHCCPLDVHRKDGRKQRTLTFDGLGA